MSNYYLKNKAKKAFISREYSKALEIYSYLYNSLSNKTMDNDKYDRESLAIKTCLMLCDMALDYEEEARSLYEYYTISKSKKDTSLEKSIIGMIESFDKNISELNSVVDKLREIDVDKNDGILYSDFDSLAKEVGFKRAFENLMFSSKIIFTSRNEFLCFVRNLVEFGYEDIAMNYFENTGSIFYFDREFMQIYRKLIRKEF